MFEFGGSLLESFCTSHGHVIGVRCFFLGGPSPSPWHLFVTLVLLGLDLASSSQEPHSPPPLAAASDFLSRFARGSLDRRRALSSSRALSWLPLRCFVGDESEEES